MKIDTAGVSGGVFGLWIGHSACVSDGMKFRIYYKVPYKIQCNNGVQYSGEYFANGWEQGVRAPGFTSDDGARKGDVSFESGCGKSENDSYLNHNHIDNRNCWVSDPVWVADQETGLGTMTYVDRYDPSLEIIYPAVYVDSQWRIRNMYFNYSGLGVREIGSINSNWVKFPGQAIVDSWKGITVKLPPYKGGEKKLSRPTLFVHGLEVPYTETWGVSAPSCDPSDINVDLNVLVWDSIASKDSLSEMSEYDRHGSVTKKKVYTSSFGYRVKIPMGGTCADGSSLQWKMEVNPVVSYSWELVTRSGVDLENSWRIFQKDHSAEIVSSHVDRFLVSGSILAWIPDDYVRRPITAPFTSMDTSDADFEWIGSGFFDRVKMRRVLLKFERPLAASETNADFSFSPAALAKGWVDTTDSAYQSGTGPDVLSRMQRLKKGAEINTNGIYFFNGYRWVSDSGQWFQPKPWWKNAGEKFPGQPGESWSLYNRISEVLTLHYGAAWETDTSLKIDLVCHSQGGISTREMLANAAGTDPVTGVALPTGAKNPANHIRKVVTINTPHFGSSTVTSLEALPPEYANSEGRLLRDSADTNILLASVTMDPGVMGRLAQSTMAIAATSLGTPAWFNTVLDGRLTDLPMPSPFEIAAFGADPSPIVGSFVAPVAGLLGLTSRFKVDMRGNWLKAYKMNFLIDPPIGDAVRLTQVNNDMDYLYGRMFSGRVKGSHLAVNSPEIHTLMQTYPKLPNGQDLQLQTLYSQVGGMGDVIHAQLREQTRGLCDLSSETNSAQCYGLADLLGLSNYDMFKKVNVNMPLMDFLDTWSKEWLAQSDVVVEASSQKALLQGNVWQPDLHPGKFLDPRSYLLRKITTLGRFPDTLIPHGTFPIQAKDTLEASLVRDAIFSKPERDTSKPAPQKVGWSFFANFELRGAPWLGHDIYCALDMGCQDLLEGSGLALPLTDSVTQVSLPGGRTASFRATTLQGDFELGAVTTDTGDADFAVLVPGETTPRLLVSWSTANGLQLTTASGTQEMIPSGWSVRPVVVRKGDTLTVRVKTWGGQLVERSVPLTGNPAQLQLGLLQTDADPVALVGKAMAIQKNSVVSARAWHMEARGSDVKLSKPRIVVENNGTEAIHGLRVVYVFRADPATSRRPVLEAPSGFPGKIEQVQGDVWRLVLNAPDIDLKPGEMWPNAEVSKISLRNADWSPWPLLKDPSEDRNWGAPRPNEKIAVYDGQGKLLWGHDLSDGGDSWYPSLPKLLVLTKEQAVNEPAVTKPEILLYNQGNTSFRKLKASWYLHLPEGKEPILGDWYTPEASISRRDLGNGYWAVDVAFDTFMLYPGMEVRSGQWGLYYNQQVDWNHAQDPSHYGEDGEWNKNPWVVVTDSVGHVLWGKLPIFPAANEPVVVPEDTLPVVVPAPLNLAVELLNEAPWEKNTAKPRVRVWNRGTEKVERFRLIFPVHEETSQPPEVFYGWPNLPNCSYSVQDRSKGDWDVSVDCVEAHLDPGGVWPTADGAAFGIRKFDWSDWNLTDDPAFAGLGTSFAPATGVQVQP